MFSSDRVRLIDSVGREAQRVVETFDRKRESAALAEGARGAVAAAAAAGAGALGLGALVTAVATTAAADVSGLLMASAMAAIGFFILPAKRRQGKAEMRGKDHRDARSPRRRAAIAVRGGDQAERQGGFAQVLRRTADSSAPNARSSTRRPSRFAVHSTRLNACGRNWTARCRSRPVARGFSLVRSAFEELRSVARRPSGLLMRITPATPMRSTRRGYSRHQPGRR